MKTLNTNVNNYTTGFTIYASNGKELKHCNSRFAAAGHALLFANDILVDKKNWSDKVSVRFWNPIKRCMERTAAYSTVRDKLIGSIITRIKPEGATIYNGTSGSIKIVNHSLLNACVAI